MEREIKFRVWFKYKEEETLLYNDVIDYIDFENEELWQYKGHTHDCCGEVERLHEIHYFDNIELMNYVGKDSKEKDLYEGDIIRIYENNTKGAKGVVVYDENDKAYKVKVKVKNDYFYSFLSQLEEYVAIGNIYENKNLLEENN